MKRSAKRSFRPVAECCEDRCVATAHLAAAAFDLHALSAAHHRVTHPAFHTSRPQHHHHQHKPAGQPSSPGQVGTPGMLHFRLPSNYLDYGVVTIWNNTNAPATFQLSASTFNNGQFYPFTLPSGGVQSYFAPVVNGQAPLFQVSFNANRSNPIPLPQENIVFQSSTWVPTGTAGWPYAIGFGVNGYDVAPI
jgi:hypothetical protein